MYYIVYLFKFRLKTFSTEDCIGRKGSNEIFLLRKIHNRIICETLSTPRIFYCGIIRLYLNSDSLISKNKYFSLKRVF